MIPEIQGKGGYPPKIPPFPFRERQITEGLVVNAAFTVSRFPRKEPRSSHFTAATEKLPVPM